MADRRLADLEDEYLGNPIIVLGNTRTIQKLEPQRCRSRVPRGCQSRFLMLDFVAIPGAHPRRERAVASDAVTRPTIFLDETNRTLQVVSGSAPRPPERRETDVKDTVTAPPRPPESRRAPDPASGVTTTSRAIESIRAFGKSLTGSTR